MGADALTAMRADAEGGLFVVRVAIMANVFLLTAFLGFCLYEVMK